MLNAALYLILELRMNMECCVRCKWNYIADITLKRNVRCATMQIFARCFQCNQEINFKSNGKSEYLFDRSK